MILERDFPPDDRPEKEAISLIKAGFDIYLLCYTSTKKPLSEEYKGIKITRFELNKKLYKKLSATYLILPLYKMKWRKHIEKFISSNKIDIIHIHDLPMTDIAHEMAERYNCKVVCDQHEFWSNWIGNTAHYNTFIGKIVKYFSNWKKYERDNLQKADLVITVEEPLKALYMSEVGICDKKIVIVPNTPRKDIFYNPSIDKKIIDKYKDNFVIFYAGVLDKLRGVDIVIKALSKISKQIPNLKFVMAGRFAKNYNLLELASKLNVSHMVEFVGWLQVDQLPTYMYASDICIFTPLQAASQEINNTIATKIYQYTAMKKPIITSNVKMMKKYVENNDLGFSVRQGDVDDFVKTAIYINKNYRKVIQKVEIGSTKLIENNSIFWENTILPMLEHYDKL